MSDDERDDELQPAEEPEVVSADDSSTADDSTHIRKSVRQMISYVVKDKDDDTRIDKAAKAIPRASDKDIEELRSRIVQYFYDCDHARISVMVRNGKELVETFEPQIYTIAGLTLALGLTSRDEMRKYRKTPGFAEILGWATLKMEDQRNQDLLRRTTNPAGVIFDLKNNFKWTDQPSTKRIGVEVTLEEALEEIAGKSRGLPKDRMLERRRDKREEIRLDKRKKARTDRKPTSEQTLEAGESLSHPG